MRGKLGLSQLGAPRPQSDATRKHRIAPLARASTMPSCAASPGAVIESPPDAVRPRKCCGDRAIGDAVARRLDGDRFDRRRQDFHTDNGVAKSFMGNTQTSVLLATSVRNVRRGESRNHGLGNTTTTSRGRIRGLTTSRWRNGAAPVRAKRLPCPETAGSFHRPDERADAFRRNIHAGTVRRSLRMRLSLQRSN